MEGTLHAFAPEIVVTSEAVEPPIYWCDTDENLLVTEIFQYLSHDYISRSVDLRIKSKDSCHHQVWEF